MYYDVTMHVTEYHDIFFKIPEYPGIRIRRLRTPKLPIILQLCVYTAVYTAVVGSQVGASQVLL